MRSLADELGVTPMAAYHHVHDKTELIDLVLEAVMGTVPIPDPASGSWSERLWQINRNTREGARRPPWPGGKRCSTDRPHRRHNGTSMQRSGAFAKRGSPAPRRSSPT